MPGAPTPLTPRWRPHKHHDTQAAVWWSAARFLVLLAGRRSGKTETMLRRKVRRLFDCNLEDGWLWLLSPTYKLSRRIHWPVIKAMIPRQFVRAKNETDMTIETIWGPKLTCAGTEEPDLLRGPYADDVSFDEVDFMKDPTYTWEGVFRPMLSTPGREPGSATFGGTPDGRSFLWKLYNKALRPDETEWEGYRWSSEGIIDAKELEQAKRDMDPKLYRQEYGAEALLMSGRAYEFFETDLHARYPVAQAYSPVAPLAFCLDFNRAPGSAVVAQEIDFAQACRILGWVKTPVVADVVEAAIGQVHIPYDSNTRAVCRKLVADWGRLHLGRILIYGDPTGGAKGTAKLDGSDWDIVEAELRPVFGDRLEFRVDSWVQAGDELRRINAINGRCRNAEGTVRLLVDPEKAPQVVEDMEGVRLKEGVAGKEIDKSDQDRTHWTDGWGYRILREYPVRSGRDTVVFEAYS